MTRTLAGTMSSCSEISSPIATSTVRRAPLCRSWAGTVSSAGGSGSLLGLVEEPQLRGRDLLARRPVALGEQEIQLRLQVLDLGALAGQLAALLEHQGAQRREVLGERFCAHIHARHDSNFAAGP